MSPDVASVLLRACSLIALLQAAGVVLFAAAFGWQQHSRAGLRRLGLGAVIAAVVLICLHQVLEAGRMGGDWASVLDRELQLLAWQGSLGSAWLARLAALALMVTVIVRPGRQSMLLGVGGVALLVFSFALVGHTHEASLLWLRLMLAAHLATVIFWFGSLLPLRLVLRDEPASPAAHTVQQFSTWAVWLVAVLFFAGVALLAGLLPSWSALLEPYGLLVLGKLAGFAVLLVLAAYNKFRYAPRLVEQPTARLTLRHMILAEYLLMCGVLTATATLTGFFSPEAG